jgi:hypothetical protein
MNAKQFTELQLPMGGRERLAGWLRDLAHFPLSIVRRRLPARVKPSKSVQILANEA